MYNLITITFQKSLQVNTDYHSKYGSIQNLHKDPHYTSIFMVEK